MHTVYVVRSLKNGKRYVGCTSRKITERLGEHKYGSVKWPSKNGPFELVYTEVHTDLSRALAREKFFKTGQGRKVLQNHLLRSERG